MNRDKVESDDEMAVMVSAQLQETETCFKGFQGLLGLLTENDAFQTKAALAVTIKTVRSLLENFTKNWFAG